MANKITIGCGIAAVAVTTGLVVEHQINKTRQGAYACGGHRTTGQGSIVQKTTRRVCNALGLLAFKISKVSK